MVSERKRVRKIIDYYDPNLSVNEIFVPKEGAIFKLTGITKRMVTDVNGNTHEVERCPSSYAYPSKEKRIVRDENGNETEEMHEYILNYRMEKNKMGESIRVPVHGDIVFEKGILRVKPHQNTLFRHMLFAKGCEGNPKRIGKPVFYLVETQKEKLRMDLKRRQRLMAMKYVDSLKNGPELINEADALGIDTHQSPDHNENFDLVRAELMSIADTDPQKLMSAVKDEDKDTLAFIKRAQDARKLSFIEKTQRWQSYDGIKTDPLGIVPEDVDENEWILDFLKKNPDKMQEIQERVEKYEEKRQVPA